MKREFFQALYPAMDVRPSIPWNERLARAAYDILRGPTDWVYFAAAEIGEPPKPNKSARVYSREPAGMGEWVTVEGSKKWWAELDEWLLKADSVVM